MVDPESDNKVLKRELDRDADFARRWREAAARRALSFALAGIRHQAELTQSELGERAGWRQAHVARLESPQGPQPGLDTLARYAEACGQQMGVVFGRSGADGQFRVSGGCLVPARTDEEPQTLFGGALPTSSPE